MKRRRQLQSKDGKAEESVKDDHSSSAEKPAKRKRSAYKSARRIGGNVYKACGCAMPWWQCLLAWAAFVGLFFAVRLVLHFSWHKTAVQYQQCSVPTKKMLCYRPKMQGKSTLPRTGSGLEKCCLTKGCVPSIQLLWCLVSQGTLECSSAVSVASPEKWLSVRECIFEQAL